MKTLLLIFLLLGAGANSWAVEREGTDQGNGGDSFATEFVSIARSIVTFVKTENYLPESVKEKFIAAVNEAQVESTDEPLFLKGIPKDALNFPSVNRILFNRARWASNTPKAKYALVLHEYFGLIEEETSSYRISAQILESFFFGRPNCSFATAGAPSFLVPPRHMNARFYTMAEAVYLGISFALRAEGKLVRLEARKANGDLVGSAMSLLESESLHPELSLSLVVQAEDGHLAEVNCSTRRVNSRP